MGRPLVLLAIAATVVAGCTSTGHSSTPTTTSAEAAARAAAARQAAAQAAAAAAARAAASSTTAPTCSNANGPDYIVWTQTPGTQPSATQLGAYNLATCTPTPQFVQSTSPTDSGDCTIVAPVSANPGYDINATPAPKPKNAVMTVGGAC